MLKRFWILLVTCFVTSTVYSQGITVPYTLISRVMETGPRIVAISIDAGRDLPMNWKLASAFKVSAELLPVKSYAGDLIGNSAVSKAPRTITRAYTSAQPVIGSPNQGRYIIVELESDDYNAASWYLGFSTGIRQLIPYKESLVYEVRLLNDLNYFSPNASPTKPGAPADTIKTDVLFKQVGSKIVTADSFVQSVLEMPTNASIKFLPYNLYKPADVQAGAKVPLVVFLHGRGQSHDFSSFPNDQVADVLSPLYANQGGTTWIENVKEKAFVLAPQAPAVDSRDAAGESGWRSADTQTLLMTLIDKVIAENPQIDVSRLYLTGLSMGGTGSWKILSNADPKISRKFAAAVVICGVPIDNFFPVRSGTPSEREAKILGELKAFDFSKVTTPLWLFHSNTDPINTSFGARVPFVKLTKGAELAPNGELTPSKGVLISDNGLVRQYRGINVNNGTEVRYTEYLFNQGDQFREIGMVTRHGHFSWEAAHKDQAMIDWMFRQARK